MRIRVRSAFAGLLVFANFAITGAPLPRARAQVARDPLAELRSRSALSDEDRAAIKAWIDERLGALVGGAPGGAAAAELRNALTAAPEPSAAFREAFVTALCDAGRQKYGQASRPESAARVVALLANTKKPAAAPVLVEALRDRRAAVRAAAAVGLRDLRPDLAAVGGAYVTDAVNALREAGRRETSGPALRAMYQALNYPEVVPNPPDARLLISAWLDILEARSALHATEGVTAQGAELAGVRVGAAFRALMNDDERRRYLACLARLLRAAVARYTAELHKVSERESSPRQIELRNETEQLIQETELQLVDLLGLKERPPSVHTELSRSGDLAKARHEFDKWAELLGKALGQDFGLEAPTTP